MSSNPIDKKYVRGQYSRSFEDIAKMPLDERHRVLGDMVKTPKGKADMERYSRAGERYQALRERREIQGTRNSRAEQAEAYLTQGRTPPAIAAPYYMQSATGRFVRLTDRDLQQIDQGIGAVIDSSDKALKQTIHAERLALECTKRESIITVEEREAQRSHSQRPTTREAIRANKRDMGLGE